MIVCQASAPIPGSMYASIIWLIIVAEYLLQRQKIKQFICPKNWETVPKNREIFFKTACLVPLFACCVASWLAKVGLVKSRQLAILLRTSASAIDLTAENAENTKMMKSGSVLWWWYSLGGAMLLTSRLARTLAPPKLQTVPLPVLCALCVLCG